MKISILGNMWHIIMYTDDKLFTKEVADGDIDVEAMTITEQNTISFRKTKFNLHTVVHELFHAYVAACCLEHYDIDKSSFEESCGDLIAKYGRTLLDQADQIVNEFKEEPK